MLEVSTVVWNTVFHKVELDGGIRSSNTTLSNINLQHHHHEYTVYINICAYGEDYIYFLQLLSSHKIAHKKRLMEFGFQPAPESCCSINFEISSHFLFYLTSLPSTDNICVYTLCTTSLRSRWKCILHPFGNFRSQLPIHQGEFTLISSCAEAEKI